MVRLWLTTLVVLAAAATAAGERSILNSPHDLSMMSPNSVRAIAENQICVFCHSAHFGLPGTGGWNRFDPTTYYRVYRSSTMQARVDQPTGSSRMCLSCHDGSMHLGQIRSQPATDPIPMTAPTMPPGPSNLTNDLSDDHPIGFRYDRAIRNMDPQIFDPQRVSPRLPLGPRNEVECQTCHDPHDNELGDFLRLPERRGALCLTCHDLDGWHVSAHAGAVRGITALPLDPDSRLEFGTVADNACGVCHDVHGAQNPRRLLRRRDVDQLCLECHNGTAATDILAVTGLPHNHKGSLLIDRHDPAEDPRTMPDHVSCVDCHDPHMARNSAERPGLLHAVRTTGGLAGAPGVSILGRPRRDAEWEYEVCLRCHGDTPVRVRNRITRVHREDNLRRQISPSALSSHPFVRPDSSSEVPSLLPQLRGEQIACTDCHNSNNAESFGGNGPDGPHGSIHPFLLALRYETATFVNESPQAYALCYRCHQRESILADESFSLHRRHVVDANSPCSACHDPHGTLRAPSTGDQLINFDRAQVSPVPGEGGVIYRDGGRFTGSCTLQCHGVTHVNFTYSQTGATGVGRAAAR